MNISKTQKITWIVIALSALLTASIGIITPSVYAKVVKPDLIPAVIAPDLLTIFCSLALLRLIAREKGDIKKQIIVQGILGYFFYNYGVYVIERLYNPLYLLYMIIFTLSFWSLLNYVGGLTHTKIQARLPEGIRWSSLVVALLQPAVFYPLWVSHLIPLMGTGEKIEFLYSIYILDLCFIMPAFLMISLYIYKKKALGMVLAPIIFILGFLVIFSLAITDIIKPYFQAEPGTGSFTSAITLSALFLIMAIIHISKLQITRIKLPNKYQ